MTSDDGPLKHLDRMGMAAIALDQDGFVIQMTDTAKAIFDNDINVKDRRLFVRDPDAMALLNAEIDQLKTSTRLFSIKVIVPRQGKPPLSVRISPFECGRAMVLILGRRPWPLLLKHTPIA